VHTRASSTAINKVSIAFQILFGLSMDPHVKWQILDLVTAHCTSQRKTCLQTKLCCELSNLYPSGEEASQLSNTICQFVTAARAFVFLLYSCQVLARPNLDDNNWWNQYP
jgi:hypothetical protein